MDQLISGVDTSARAQADPLMASAASLQEAQLAVRQYEMTDEPITEADRVESAAQLTELSIDDGSAEQLVGSNQPNTLFFVNRLRPPSFPATLSQVSIFFPSTNSNLTAGASFTVLSGSNPSGGENINGIALQQTNASIPSLGQFRTFGVPSLTITSGDFVVGFSIQIQANVFPGALDTDTPQRRSYLSSDGVNFTLTENLGNFGVPPGSWLIRAQVTLQQPPPPPPPTGLTGLVASFIDSNRGNNGTGDLTILQSLSGSPTVDGNIVTTGDNAEVVVAPNGQYAIAYPTGNAADSVSVITGLQSNPVESRVLPVGDLPNAVAITPDSTTAIVINALSQPTVTYQIITGLPNAPSVSNLFSISSATNTVAEDVALSPSGNTAIVSLFQANQVAVIDGVRSGSPFVRATVNVGNGPNGVAFTLDGSTAFVANTLDNSIEVISGFGGTPFSVNRIRNGVGTNPQAIQLTPDGSKAVVTNTGGNTVSVFQVAGQNLNLLQTLTVGQSPAGLAISSDGRIALVANAGERTVSVIRGLDTSSPFVAATLGPSAQLDTATFAERSVAIASLGGPPPGGPVLSVTPTSLTFNAVANQGNPPSQQITVANTGSGSFSFNISSSNSGLVNVSPSSGTLSAGQSTTVTVFVTNPNQVGTRTAFLTVNASGAQNSPQTVNVTVNTTGPAAILNVTPTSLTFNAVANQGNPPSQQITLSNTGSGSFSFNISSSDSSLVNVSPTSGTVFSGQPVTVNVFVTNPNQVGTRTAFLTVNASGAQNSPQTVNVTVNTTGPAAILSVTPTSLTFNAMAGQGNPPPQTITVRNTGGGFLSFTITSNSSFVSASPTSGTLSGGQSQTVQVSAINPNSPGTINAQLTVSASGAQNSPQFVNVTINTQAGGATNTSPQTATPLNIPSPGQSTTISGNATPDDPGTTVNQLVSECNLSGVVQRWYRFDVAQRDSFRASLSFSGADIDFDLFWFIQSNDAVHFPQGIQLVAFSAQGPGQPETLGPRLLEPGTYFLGVSRVRRNNSSDFQRVNFTLTLTRGVSPELHVIEDVACIAFVDTDQAKNGFFVVNRVRPTRYPARLEAISVLFIAAQGQPSPAGRPVRIIVFTDLSGSGVPPSNPPLVVDQTVTVGTANQFNQLNLGTSGPVINSGDFYVGYVVDRSNGIFLNLGRVLYPNIRSFFSNNGGQTYQQLNSQTQDGQPLNVAIRSTVNTRPFGEVSAAEASNPPESEKMEMIRPRIISTDVK